MELKRRNQLEHLFVMDIFTVQIYSATNRELVILIVKELDKR